MRKWFGVTAEVPIELNQSPSIRSSPVRHLATIGLAGFLLLSSGCGSSPEQLAKDAASAMKSGNFEQIIRIAEKVSKLSPEEQRQYQAAFAKEMGGMMGDLKNAGEGLMKDFNKGWGNMPNQGGVFGGNK
jgi:hypothetical protein